MIRTDSKLRVWWIPQVGVSKTLYVPVDSPEEGYKILHTLAYYDRFLEENNVRGDYCNTGGLLYFDLEDQSWYNWYFEDEKNFYEDLDEYIAEQRSELLEFSNSLAKQVTF